MVGPRQQAQQQQQYRGKSQAEQRQRNHVGQDRQKYPTHKELRNEQEVNSQRFQQEQHETCQHYGMQQNNPQEKQPAPAAEQPWAASPRAHVEFLGGKRARGLVASEAIEASEVIYTEETPLLAVQHEFSRLCGLTCSNCLRFVGSLKDCIRHVLNHAGRHEVLGAVSLIPDGFIKKAGLSLGPVVPCGEAECPAVFCSKRCLEHARQETLHRMVCVEATERTAWLEFLSHARKHHDGLVMAGVCMAQIVFEVIFKGRQFSEVVRPFLEFYSAPWESLAPNRLLANGPPPSGDFFACLSRRRVPTSAQS
ncbi:hypothetical protein, conserved [Eimeria maxima]|uniref:C2H2-type domain-containing protein n=1 Tax=Eimeria maxima TaxID=5804 RepID=U6M129_EIMMA|nr:hypothetical protein, conserved [Eimeria maxima]CDJ56798.1 hypothetical protein, conserved [Eimeria maxima]